MGGMAAQIPVKNDDQANEQAFEKVRNDKEREANNGHDGTWVAHPGLVPIALEVFDNKIPGNNQLDMSLDNISITQKDLLKVHEGERIFHQKFGYGTILKIDGEKVEIKFEKSDTKKVLMSFIEKTN